MNIVNFNGEKYLFKTKMLLIDHGKYSFQDGNNWFDDKSFKQLEKEPFFQEGLKENYFSVISTQDTEKVASKRASPKKIEISSLSLEEAKILAAAENDKNKLRGWLKEEKENQNRAEVLALLDANLKTGITL